MAAGMDGIGGDAIDARGERDVVPHLLGDRGYVLLSEGGVLKESGRRRARSLRRGDVFELSGPASLEATEGGRSTLHGLDGADGALGATRGERILRRAARELALAGTVAAVAWLLFATATVTAVTAPYAVPAARFEMPALVSALRAAAAESVEAGRPGFSERAPGNVPAQGTPEWAAAARAFDRAREIMAEAAR